MSLKDNSVLVLFGGLGREATVLRLQAEGYRIKAVVTSAKASPPAQESLEIIEDAGINVIKCLKETLRVTLDPFAGCTLISISFPYLLPGDLLAKFRVCLNVHPTLLPHYRGPTSGAYILVNNEPETGSTVQEIDAGMDTGPIVLQRTVKLSRFDTIRSMQRKTFALEPDLLIDALQLMDTPGFEPVQQDESQATIYPKKRRPEDSEIDPNKSLVELFDTIRACDPEDFPAFFFIEGQKVCIRLWRPERPVEEDDDTL